LKSLRKQLTIHLSRLLLIIWLATTVLAFFAARHEVTDIFDERLQDYATLLTEIAYRRINDLEERGIDVAIKPPNTSFEYKSDLAFRIWRKGKLAANSTGAVDFPMPDQPGFYYRRMATSDVHKSWKHREDTDSDRKSDLELEDWVFYAKYDPDFDLWVVVAEIDDVREILIGKVILQIVWPVIFVFPLLFVALYFSIQKQLTPLQRITRQIGRRSPEDLLPLKSDAAPAELLPVIESLNQLLDRLSSALQAERRFTANASHEMRTPLAALLTQVQIAERQCDTPVQKEALVKIRNRVDRLTHLVDQLLTLARFDPKHTSSELVPFEVTMVCEDVLADLANYASEKHIEISLDIQQPVHVVGLETYFAILLRNLVDNAIRYSPENTHVGVLFRAEKEHYCLTVVDEGPGIPDAEKEEIFAYFSRGEHNDTVGSGIGLAIVWRIAELMKGTITLEDNPKGGSVFIFSWPKEIYDQAKDT